MVSEVHLGDYQQKSNKLFYCFILLLKVHTLLAKLVKSFNIDL